jgi:hypothetical protein
MKKYFSWLLASIWLAAVSSGTGGLWVYEHTPGGAAGVPDNWPSQSKFPRAMGQPTLILFAHPKCPCTRASIGELMVLMTHCQNRVDATVVFFRPKGSGEDWLRTDLWRSAEAIPGVRVRADQDGDEVRRFQVTTSGHVVLYDVDGKLLFSGGITSARGHYGDNAGCSAIMALLNHNTADVSKTPVFGCPLLNPESECSAKDTVCTP